MAKSRFDGKTMRNYKKTAWLASNQICGGSWMRVQGGNISIRILAASILIQINKIALGVTKALGGGGKSRSLTRTMTQDYIHWPKGY